MRLQPHYRYSVIKQGLLRRKFRGGDLQDQFSFVRDSMQGRPVYLLDSCTPSIIYEAQRKVMIMGVSLYTPASVDMYLVSNLSDCCSSLRGTVCCTKE